MSWQRQRERGSHSAMGLMAWIVTHIGYQAGWLLLYPIAFYFLLSSPRQRRHVSLFLERALRRRPGWNDLFRLYFTFAATLLDRLFLLDGRRSDYRIEVHGLEAVQAHIAKGQGCILLGAHLGSFDALRAIADAGCPVEVVALMHAEHAAISSGFFADWAAGSATRVISLGQPDAMLQARECLERGGLVGILADRTPQTPGTAPRRRRVPFLGRDAAFPEGPHILAGVLGAPVMLAYGVWTGKRRYEVHFEPLTDRIALERHRRREALGASVADYAVRIGGAACAFPYNWFNFHDFWEEVDTT
ncbi:hypothetical protein ACFOD4_15545 [Pseudoroseomonas globiformis]|uniref:Lipid A biosynthesis acyltransferase n=1 Tax=Teichococcus globiformis TaxID=2307229 RepID=A0ABV7G8E7_9PROT